MTGFSDNVIGVVGWKDSGKTSLVERLVTYFTARGVTVSTVKHAHHDFDVDQPGRDSFRHRGAGAHEVLVSSTGRFALMRELRGAPEPDLAALLDRLSPVALVLVEGFKREAHPKIEVWRAAHGEGQGLIARSDPTVVAVAADVASLDVPGLDVPCPLLALDDTAAIAAFIAARVGIELRPGD
ncbi:MAG: molybdopterin-guanine dinucleotide biosynthesis protein B [Sphingomonadales bacterium]